jgi:hypothetical protein
MQLRRLFVGGYQELRRPINVVDESLMTRIEKAREELQLQGKDVIAVLGPSAEPHRELPAYTRKGSSAITSDSFNEAL